jgi:hypothetical protein
MKFSKLDLLTLLISLFLFASCENTSTIGLEVDPSSAVQGSLVDSITITSRTMGEDETPTNSATRHPLGYMKDVLFGTTESSLAMAVNLPNDAYDFGTTPVIDSAILVLNYGGEFYGDSTATYSIDVHPLNVNISKETSFLSNRDWTYNSQLIGNKTGKLYPTTKYKVTDIVAGKADTLRTVTPQLRIPLDKDFIQNNIANLSATSLKYNSNFARVFNGLHVQINKTNSTGNGGVAFFEFTGTTSALVLYYKKQNATTTTLKDTVSVNFPIIANTVDKGPIAATIKHDYTGTPVATQLSNPTLQYPATYLQPLVGLRNKIAFPYLNKFATNIGKIVVNKAELVIDLNAGTDVIPYGAAPRLALYRYDLAEQRQNVPDNNSATQNSSGDPRSLDPIVFGGYYNSVTKQYIFVITSYIQDLLNGKTKDYGTFLAPTPTNEYQISPSISTGARSVIGSFKKTPVVGDNLMKLNIYYTKIN